MVLYDVHIKLHPHAQKNFVAKVNTLIQFLRPQGLIQANHLIYSDCSSLDGCKIVVKGSLIHFMINSWLFVCLL